MNPFIIVAKGTVTLAAFGTGIYLYNRYKKDRRRMLGMTAGMLVGHKIGAAAGGLFGGPMGAMVGMTAGCMSGCMVGGTLAEPSAECCDEPTSEKKLRKTG